MKEKQKIVVSITGASGAIYAKLLIKKLELLLQNEEIMEVSLIFSSNAKDVWKYEIGIFEEEKFPFPIYEKNSFEAPFASGSAKYSTMIICPCSMGTLGRIAAGISDDLTTRAADVMLKERRKLILVTRETPLNLIHLQNMKTITLAGGIICPASPSFYSKPQTVAQLAETVVDRVLDLSNLPVETFRWNE